MRTFCTRTAGGSLLLVLLTLPAIAHAQMSDADLTQKVVTQVQQYSRFTMFDDIRIAVENRVVTLTGTVTIPVKKSEIAKRVAALDGVRQLVNDIHVLPLSPTDDALRMKIARAIYNHPQFWQIAGMAQPPIHIIVEHGHVTLLGRVGTELDKALAYSLAQVPGAFSVKNQLRVETASR
jgi:hyperosmotically inducible protein